MLHGPGGGFFKKSPLAAGGKREYEWAVLLLSGYFITPIRDSRRACVVSERSALTYSVRHKVQLSVVAPKFAKIRKKIGASQSKIRGSKP